LGNPSCWFTDSMMSALVKAISGAPSCFAVSDEKSQKTMSDCGNFINNFN
jgi:hypothetical protein